MANSKIDINDERWGGYCPWFLRYDDFSGSGNFLLFFDRLQHRIGQLLRYNETGINNLSHFAHMLDSKSLRRFWYDISDRSGVSYLQIADYFNPLKIKYEISVIEATKNFLQLLIELAYLKSYCKYFHVRMGF